MGHNDEMFHDEHILKIYSLGYRGEEKTVPTWKGVISGARGNLENDLFKHVF